MSKGQYIQYGCGFSAPSEWKNFDASPTLRFERLPLIGGLYTRNKSRFPVDVEYGDIVKGLKLADGSCKAVYCSHILEHLALSDFRMALLNTFRILETGGVFRFVLPDLEYSAQKYVQDKSADSAKVFLRETSLGRETRSCGIKGFVLDWLGNSQHLWMWDFRSIEAELENAGFVSIRRAMYGDFEDPMFEAVEDEGRWINCLGVECRKS